MVSMQAELTSLSFWAHVLFSSLGASILYHQWGRSELRAYSLSAFFDTLKFENQNARSRAEMITFIIIGTLIAMGVGHPQTVPQAFAAGAGFTGLAVKPNSASSKRKAASKGKLRSEG
jgi:hypothetical protein